MRASRSLLLLTAATLAAGAGLGLAEREESAVRFDTVDVVIDSGKRPLAAYQFQLEAVEGDVTIVGIEGAASGPFSDAPYYDPEALSGGRIIVGDFIAKNERDLPTGATRVARLHVRIAGEREPDYRASLHTAGTAGGEPISADIRVRQQGDDP